jgi:hypothetical protein
MKVYTVKITLDTVFVAPDNATKEELEDLALKAVGNEIKINKCVTQDLVKVELGTKKILKARKLWDVIPWFGKGERYVCEYEL